MAHDRWLPSALAPGDPKRPRWAYFANYTDVAFLWLNIVGAVAVVVVGLVVSAFTTPEVHSPASRRPVPPGGYVGAGEPAN